MVKLNTVALRSAWLQRRFTSDTVQVEIEDIDTMTRSTHTAEVIGQKDGYTQVHIALPQPIGGMVAVVYLDRMVPPTQRLRRGGGDWYHALVRLAPEQPDHDNIGELADLDRHVLAIRDREEDRQAS